MSKNHEKTSQNPCPKHEKNDEKIILFCDDVFFQFGGQFGGA